MRDSGVGGRRASGGSCAAASLQAPVANLVAEMACFWVDAERVSSALSQTDFARDDEVAAVDGPIADSALIGLSMHLSPRLDALDLACAQAPGAPALAISSQLPSSHCSEADARLLFRSIGDLWKAALTASSPGMREDYWGYFAQRDPIHATALDFSIEWRGDRPGLAIGVTRWTGMWRALSARPAAAPESEDALPAAGPDPWTTQDDDDPERDDAIAHGDFDLHDAGQDGADAL